MLIALLSIVFGQAHKIDSMKALKLFIYGMESDRLAGLGTIAQVPDQGWIASISNVKPTNSKTLTPPHNC